ncbi:MAG TPA: DNA polymerase III subunit delta' [Mycobacteriales bacterium]|nr:DNA polymerase III subunit delta' [Mycobacteriales bacterium]
MSVFDGLVGQQAVIGQLTDAVSGKGMTHAWLFTGPPGSGRSVAARAFAAALQCPRSGCGSCDTCRQAMGGTHADVAVVVPEGLSLGVEETRAIVMATAHRPTQSPWQVTLIEDADRLTDQAANALLKAIEEPPPSGVVILCAPTLEDVLPTIRSRCRVVALVTPPSDAVAALLVADGVDPAMAAFAAQAAQGHVGRARRLATDETARRERREVLALPGSLQGVGAALNAAKNLVDAARAEASELAALRDEPERDALATALGAGATGKGLTGSTPRGGAGALKELEKNQKSRATRTQRDSLDRALVDLAAFYRDVLALQLGAAAVPVHADLTQQSQALAGSSTAEDTLRRIVAVLACRTAIEGNVNVQLAVDAMALSLR